MQAGRADGASGSLQGIVGGDGVDAADGADAAIAGEDLIAEVARVGAEAPLVDAVVAAECAAASGQDFEIAPTTEGKVVGTDGQGLPRGAASGKGAGGEHALSG